VARGQGGRGFDDAGILGDDVAGAAVLGIGETGAVAVELVESRVAETGDGEAGGGFVAFGPAAVVLTRRDSVANHGIGNDHADVRGQPEEAEGKVAAIEKQGVAGAPVAGDELVHDAAAGADELVLGLLADEGEGGRVEREAGVGGQSEGGRDLQGRRGAESGADGEVAGDGQVGAVEAVSFLLEDAGDAVNVVGPVAAGASRSISPSSPVVCEWAMMRRSGRGLTVA